MRAVVARLPYFHAEETHSRLRWHIPRPRNVKMHACRELWREIDCRRDTHPPPIMIQYTQILR